MALISRFQNLSGKRKTVLLGKPEYSGMSRKQVRRKYNKKADRINRRRLQKTNKIQQKSNKEAARNFLLGKSGTSLKPFSGQGPLKSFGNKPRARNKLAFSGSTSYAPGASLGPAPKKAKTNRFGLTTSTTTEAPGVSTNQSAYTPPTNLPGSTKVGPGVTTRTGGNTEIDPPLDPPTTDDELKGIVGNMEFGIQPDTPPIDYTRFLPKITLEDPESQELSDPKFAGVRTDISGGSAGGIRRRRSKRSRLGISALGTQQLRRGRISRLSLGGINY